MCVIVKCILSEIECAEGHGMLPVVEERCYPRGRYGD